MVVTKKVIDVYKVREEQGIFGWADIAIDAGWIKSGHGEQNCFRVSISSDYGNWAFFWSHPGKCWRSFLMKISIDYAASKFGANGWFDSDGTERWLKRDISEARRQGSITAEQAREAWEAIEGVIMESGDHPDLICERLINSDWIKAWGGDWLDRLNMNYGICPRFRAFWDGPWKEFIQVIEKERQQVAA